MTLRGRLAIGLVAIALILLVPLLLALHALRTAGESARGLGDAEFAASLLMGRVRKGLEDIRAAETALLFVHDELSRERMLRHLSDVSAMSDTLAQFQLAEAAQLKAAVAILEDAAEREYVAARAGRVAEAERISTEMLLPVLETMQRSVLGAEEALRERTRERVVAAAEATSAAQAMAAGAFMVALVLAFVIGLWLTRSIARPVRWLERGMAAIAGGDFEHRLPFTPSRRDEFGRLAASYQSMARQLADLDRLKAEFISVASHELKTPINVIVGYAELLREGVYGELTPKQAEVCRSIERQSQTLTRLVHQLLDVSRFEAGGGRIEPKPVDLHQFVTGLEESFRVLAIQREIDFSVHRGPGLPPNVEWDEDRMNEVLGNLLSNAFKFTDRGGRVRMELGAQDSSVRIEVSDTGVGIPPEQLPRVFEKFYQAGARATPAPGSAGLGLAIAKQIVEAHQGSIEVRSTQEEGTTFLITLPEKVTAARWSVPHRQTDLSSS